MEVGVTDAMVGTGGLTIGSGVSGGVGSSCVQAAKRSKPVAKASGQYRSFIMCVLYIAPQRQQIVASSQGVKAALLDG